MGTQHLLLTRNAVERLQHYPRLVPEHELEERRVCCMIRYPLGNGHTGVAVHVVQVCHVPSIINRKQHVISSNDNSLLKIDFIFKRE